MRGLTDLPTTSRLNRGALAFAQIIVHVVFFLHINMSPEQRRNDVALGYTALAAFFLIGGAMWVMHNVSMNMLSR